MAFAKQTPLTGIFKYPQFGLSSQNTVKTSNPDGNLSSHMSAHGALSEGHSPGLEAIEAQNLITGAGMTAPHVNGLLCASDSCLEHEDSNSIYLMKHT